ncbi:MAG: hypothetical protein U1B30_15860 [Pseudomonadota bacterium]|nr:hypothetical protein [Pseudomonadota bacterium]
MTLVELLNIANQGYPDMTLEQLYNHETGEPVDNADEIGDTLALFILRELRDTFNPDASEDVQVGEAIRVVEMAIDDLMAVASALERDERAGSRTLP